MKLFTSLLAMALGLTSLSANAVTTQAPSADDPSMVWGWCQEPDGDPGWFPSGFYSSQAIGFTETLTKKFAGGYVTSIIVAKGYYVEEPVIDLFLCKGTEEGRVMYADEPFVSMKNQPFPGAVSSWVEFELPEPYQIVEGEPFYAGWGFLNNNDGNLPLVSDGVCNDNLATSWMEGYEARNPEYGYWNNCTSAGALCIRLRISGDNLPDSDIVINGIEAPRLVQPGEPMSVTLEVSNAATADINDIEVRYAFPGADAQTINVEGLCIVPGQTDFVTLTGIEAPCAGNLQLDIEITSVNGKNDVDVSNNMISAQLLSLPEGVGYARNVVVEEGTGTWCGNCPRGIVAMHKMNELYPDSFIGIAAHAGSRNSPDPMEIEGYRPYLDRYIDLYPSATIDRVTLIDPAFSILEADFLTEAAVPAIASVGIDELTIMGSMVFVKPTVQFAVPEDDTQYGWAYVITENNIGPYVQTNYYRDGTLEGWDYTDPNVVMMYDEVAVAADHILGITSIPAQTAAGDTYTLPMTVDASRVKDFDNAQMIVMIVNMKTGYIENAVRRPFKESGAERVAADSNIRLQARDGKITLAAGDQADIYTLSGVKAGSLRTGEQMSVAGGIYLVRAAGTTYRLVVR